MAHQALGQDDEIIHIRSGVAVFATFYKTKQGWRVSFTKNHGSPHFGHLSKFDKYFEQLERMTFDIKRRLVEAYMYMKERIEGDGY